jgi:hypothetical protein
LVPGAAFDATGKISFADAAQIGMTERFEAIMAFLDRRDESAEISTARPSGSHNAPMRAASLTAGPNTVKSSRSAAPTL